MITASVLLFVIMGQSNAVGMAPFPSSLTYANEGRISVYTNAGTWQTPAREPLDSAAGQVDAVSADPQAAAGFVLPMVDAILQSRPNDTAIIVPCARSGSSITEWPRDLRRDTLYGSCLARVREAIAQWQDSTSVLVERVTVVWWQGETDALAGEVFRTTWAQRFARLRSDFRADIGMRVSWLVAVLQPTAPAGYPAWGTIRGYQINAPTGDPDTAYFSAGWYGCCGITYQQDGLHPTLAGYQVIGRQYAAPKWLALP